MTVDNMLRAYIKFDASVHYNDHQEPISAAIGYHIRLEGKGTVARGNEHIGSEFEVHQAEYHALLEATSVATNVLPSNCKVYVYGDSQNTIDCVNPRSKSYPSQKQSQQYVKETRRNLRYFDEIVMKRIPRTLNEEADSLAREGHIQY